PRRFLLLRLLGREPGGLLLLRLLRGEARRVLLLRFLGRGLGGEFLLLRFLRGELGRFLLLGRELGRRILLLRGELRRFLLLLFLGELCGLLLLRLLLGGKPLRLLLLRLLRLRRRLALRLVVGLRLRRGLRLDLRDRRRRLHRHRRLLGRPHGEVGGDRTGHDHAAEDAGDDHGVAPLRRRLPRRRGDDGQVVSSLRDARLPLGGERLGFHFLLPVAPGFDGSARALLRLAG